MSASPVREALDYAQRIGRLQELARQYKDLAHALSDIMDDEAILSGAEGEVVLSLIQRSSDQINGLNKLADLLGVRLTEQINEAKASRGGEGTWR